MKFQKELSQIINTLYDPIFLKTSIPYKQWKKETKYQTNQWTLLDLEQQCKIIDNVLQTKLPWITFRKPLLCCSSKVIVPNIEYNELLTYANINAQAVYKVCKKLEKTGYSGAMKFLESLRTSHKYLFMGSYAITRLKFENPEDDIDRSCPICFEDLNELRPAIILSCGHYHCYKCLEDMTHINKINAMFHIKLMLISKTYMCPICRHRNKEHLLNTDAFWPSKPQ